MGRGDFRVLQTQPPDSSMGSQDWLSLASGQEQIRTRRWPSKMDVTVKLPGSPESLSRLHARIPHWSPSPR